MASAASREAAIDEALALRTRGLADTWRRGIARTTFVPFSATEVRSVFASLAAQAVSAVTCDGDPIERGRELGAALVASGYTAPEALGSSIAILTRELQAVAPTQAPAIAALLSGIATGFTAASRERLLQDQDETRAAVLEENRRAGEAIRRQAALLELAPDAILVRALDGRILFWNRGAETLYGWSRTEALGQIVHDLLQTQFPRSRQMIESDVLSIGRWEGELVHTCRDGSVISVSSRWALQSDEQAEPQAFLEINTNITARKQMEQTLRESEASLETAQSIAHLGSWQYNVFTGETHWSAEAYRLLGYAQNEVQPSLEAYLHAVDSDDLPMVQRATQDAIEGHSYSYEYRTTARDGGPRILQSQSDAIRDASGAPQVLFGTILDVTERKRAESERAQLVAEQAARAEAEAAQTRLAFLARASARLALSLDYEQTMRTVAELAVPTLADACTVDMRLETGELARVAEVSAEGVDSADLQGCWETAVKSEPLAAAINESETTLHWDLPELAHLVDAESQAALQAIGVTAIIVAPLPARGRVLGTITYFAFAPRQAYTDVDRALAQDVAMRAGLALDNARLHAEAQRATSLRDEFLSVAAHELKTPMTTLRGYTQLLAKSTQAGDVPPLQLLDRSVNSIEAQSAKLMKLTEQLLDVSRLETGKLPVSPVPVDLVNLVRGLVHSIQQSTTRHTIDVRTPESCLVNVDPIRMEQVLANLVDNAVKYSPNGGQVEITLALADTGFVEISVRDWGLGIPPHRREHLFDRFYQAHGEGHYGGLGLGLYVSQQIVELHAGSIYAQFPEDGGSRFVIRLPSAP